MANRAAGLTIDVETTGAAAAAADLKSVGTAAKGLGEDAEKASRGIKVSADAADELAGKAGKTTGALGALSSGFELVGAEKYAGALQGAALATDFVSGAGDALNLVMESTAIKTALARGKVIAHSAATTLLAAKTGILTAATGALNIVMSLNPITLVVLAAIALAAGFVLLYNKSETFRGAIHKVGEVGKKAFDIITTPTRTLFGLLEKVAGYLKNRFPGAFDKLTGIGAKVKDVLLAPFEKIKDIIDDIIGLISKIKIPDLPSLGDLNPFGRVAVTGSSAAGAGTIVEENTYNFYGVLDFDQAAERLQIAQDRRARRLGFA